VMGSGKPTVRKAQLPSGQRMTKKRTPAAERQQETGTLRLASPLASRITGRIRAHARTSKGADVVRWACEADDGVTTLEPRDKLDTTALPC
jgi:hypothetical protein